MIIQPSSLLDYCYPVGSIYTSTKSTSPAKLFGGVWKQIKDTFLLTAGDTYTAGDTGGSATVTPSGTVAGHTLTIAEMPSHTHVQNQHRHNFPVPFGTSGGYGLVDSGTASSSGTNHWTEYATATNQNTGGGGSHNHGLTMNSQSNMPPYKVVYAWERTA